MRDSGLFASAALVAALHRRHCERSAAIQFAMPLPVKLVA